MRRILGLFLALPLLELVAFAAVAVSIGLGKALLLQVATSAIGLAMLGSLVTEAKSRADRRDGLMSFALDGQRGLRGLAGLLLAMPGFVTDILGVLALAPEFRRRLRRFIGLSEPAPRTEAPRPQAPRRDARGELLDLDQREWREVEPTARQKA